MSISIPAGSPRVISAALADGLGAVTVEDRDRTRSFLLLHGGGGPATMTGFAELLAQRTRSRVLTPTHPGFAGTPRVPGVDSTRALAAAYVDVLDDLGLSDVTVLGNSFGGWLAAEIALLGSPRVSGAVIVDGIGVEVEGHPVTSVAGLTPADLRDLSFHDPRAAPAPPAASGTGPSPDIRALVSYTGPTMSDPTLLDRLTALGHFPVHVIWGESDGIVSPEYGKAYAAAIPTSTFTLLPRSGHLPQVETPEELLGALLDLG
ncbi:alpha/beta hydrolase [Actinokineospora sp. PR83]|uniref:alpha/beta fold hydrolase n=1 Tax=Actinokineospora sp. PR83 TaxID=2884908 RepID=UPI001F3C9FF9|nr:alpha/beta hydrolase [Actinokineospora sp. PR83]MCG8919009.1 alpha/beta hydrolase [Actinokineospora sp. PR83]